MREPRLGTDVSVVAATHTEARAARHELTRTHVYESGIALRKLRDGFGDTVLSCGVAGGVRHEYHTGTVLIPRRVLRPDGTTLDCDEELVERLLRAANALGLEPLTDPLVTTTGLVTRAERELWASRGYAGVDMETGLLTAPRIAAVRVLLDTPLRELSEDWLHPVTAMLKPWNWPQLLWLAREAPRCARLAARIVHQAYEA